MLVFPFFVSKKSRNKKTTRLSGFLPTEVVRTGIEPVFHP